MNKNIIIGVLAGLLVGIIGTVGVGAVMNTPRGDHMDHSAMSMSDMNKALENKTGDDFDKAFIEMMIAHHEGAVDMAILAKDNAKHDEIKTLSEDIIAAQTKEISQMQQWQMDWGYEVDAMPGMTH